MSLNSLRKTCTRCKESKPLSGYHKSKKSRDGHMARCIECRKLPPIPKELIPDGMKKCAGCAEVKFLAEFDVHTRSAGGRRSRCKACRSLEGKEATKRRLQARREESSLRGIRELPKFYDEFGQETDISIRSRKHKISQDDFNHMAREQNGFCALCKTDEPGWIDHDHACCAKPYSCGKCIRGLLCFPCNCGLGKVSDSILILQRMEYYLDNNLFLPIDRSKILQPFNSSFYFPNDPLPWNGFSTETEKLCGICREMKPKTEFKAQKQGTLEGYCIPCTLESTKRSKLKIKYNLHLEEYYDLLFEQGYACAICEKTVEENGRLLAVDHCHEGDFIRGLLCTPCNLGLGHFRDRKLTIGYAREYLEKPYYVF